MKKKRASSPTRKVRVSFGTTQETRERLLAVAKRERMTAASLIAESLHVHLHRLETNGDPHLRRKSVCWSCGTIRDGAATGVNGGTTRAGKGSRRTTTS